MRVMRPTKTKSWMGFRSSPPSSDPLPLPAAVSLTSLLAEVIWEWRWLCSLLPIKRFFSFSLNFLSLASSYRSKERRVGSV